ncbi:hypothetical protein FEDK69T_06630 [Flavobacterium enshiense DK69]|uniref:Uncharacterized protein n=1 Tax=Flavobacterium enshiense DK69 TaxID=1107311 RepID=V6SCP6_9FLAO|nr:hypothetical protein [Flavobacterium enshiense]ESU24224.1 hypothetical protein FEDK69T_06630 [Flavobacterium enshiense DK69]KGO95398.1 hypothetical protein Q767_11385 [Flavobacterium enshiense DK69]
MRNVFLLILIPFLYLSCSKESETETTVYELLPVSEVELPTNFKINKEYTIKIKFVQPTECHTFNKIYFEKEGSIRTIAVESTVYKHSDSDCASVQNGNMTTQDLKFNLDKPGEYTLKFWKGKNSNGVDLFLTYNILVE